MINYTEQEERAKRNANNYTSSAVIIGVVLVAIGCIFVLSNIGIIPYAVKHLFISWQMLLIVMGIIGLYKGNKTAGVIFVLVGLFFILPKISILWPSVAIFGGNFTRNFWPLLIILCGIGLIVTSKRDSKYHVCSSSEYSKNMDNKDGYLNYNFVFSGTEQVFLEPVFKGGNIRTTFGGATLDFRKTSLPDNAPTILNIEATFGGVTILVPDTWDVELRHNCIFGGFTDNRYNHPISSNPNQKLIINAKCAFGGGELK